jgi:hypothetical protein
MGANREVIFSSSGSDGTFVATGAFVAGSFTTCANDANVNASIRAKNAAFFIRFSIA